MTKKSRPKKVAQVTYDFYDWLIPLLDRDGFKIVGIVSGDAIIDHESLENFQKDLAAQANVDIVFSQELGCCVIIATYTPPTYTSLSRLFNLAKEQYQIPLTKITKHSS